METRRTRRLADVIQREVANFLLRNVDDPDLKWVTVTRVTVTGDLRQTTVYYSCIDPNQLDAATKALQRIRGQVRTQLGRALRIRHTPDITFKYDKGLQHSYRIMELLEQGKAQGERPLPDGAAPEDGPGEDAPREDGDWDEDEDSDEDSDGDEDDDEDEDGEQLGVDWLESDDD